MMFVNSGGERKASGTKDSEFKKFKDICKKYDDLPAFDPIYNVKEKVETAKLIMEDNIRTMIANLDTLDSIEEISGEF